MQEYKIPTNVYKFECNGVVHLFSSDITPDYTSLPKLLEKNFFRLDPGMVGQPYTLYKIYTWQDKYIYDVLLKGRFCMEITSRMQLYHLAEQAISNIVEDPDLTRCIMQAVVKDNLGDHFNGILANAVKLSNACVKWKTAKRLEDQDYCSL